MEQNQELTFYYINKKRGELTLPSIFYIVPTSSSIRYLLENLRSVSVAKFSLWSEERRPKYIFL